MKLKKKEYWHLITLTIGLLVFTSCSPNIPLVPDPGILQAQIKTSDFEYPTILSPGEKTTILMSAHINENNKLILHMVFANLADGPLTVQPKKITVEAEIKSGKSISLKVYSAQEYIAEIQSELAAERIELAVEDMVYDSPTKKLNPYLRLYNENELISVKNNPFEWERDVLPKKMKFGNAYNTTKLELGFQQPLLTEIILNPNQFVEGDVIVRYHRGHTFIITVPTEEEIHVFSFKYSRSFDKKLL